MRKLMLALVLVLVLSCTVFAGQVDPALKGAKGMVNVIVQMNPGAKDVDVAAMGGKMGDKMEIINGFSATLPAQAIEALAKNPNVFAISAEQEITIDLNVAVYNVFANETWAEGYDGDGVTIAVIDTGIYKHQDFQSRIIAFKDYVNGKTAAYDDNGHGTHCAGIAAGNGATYDGPARNAKLVGVKVLNAQGSGTNTAIINGINWAVSNKSTYGIKIISMSLGGTVTQSSTVDPLCAAVRNAWNAGIVVVVAAGNSGPSSYTIGTPGNEPKVITVGAMDDRGTNDYSDNTIASFSSRGPTPIDYWTKPDVTAPGVNITACDNAYTGYVTMSGTSMATPLVAGVCGQILEAHPTWTPDTVKSNLKGGCIYFGLGANVEGSGEVDSYYAIH